MAASCLSGAVMAGAFATSSTVIADRRTLGAASASGPLKASMRASPTVCGAASSSSDDSAAKLARRAVLMGGAAIPVSLAMGADSASASAFVPQEIATLAGLVSDQPISDPHELLMKALPVDVTNTPIGVLDRQLADVMRPVMISQGQGRDSGLYRSVTEEGRAGRVVSDQQIAQVHAGMRRANNTLQEVVASLPKDNPATKRATDALVDAIKVDVGALDKFASLPADRFRAALDEAADFQDAARTHLGLLASLQMPAQYLPTNVALLPEEYGDLNLPMLNGRAEVEMTVKKAGGKKEVVSIVLDGFSAPVSAGNFADLIARGFYNGMEVQRSDGFVVQTGMASGKGSERTIPLEIKVKGDAAPSYGFTLDDLGRAREDPVLPFNAYGTLAVARDEMENDSGSSQFFFLLREPEITPTSANVLDGRFATMGYATQNADVLKDVRVGDRIEKMVLKHGGESITTA